MCRGRPSNRGSLQLRIPPRRSGVDRGTLQITAVTGEGITGAFEARGTYSRTALEGRVVPHTEGSVSGTFEAHRNDDTEP